MSDRCEYCDDKGWVCEAHQTHPSSTVSSRDDACDDGPGVPCPKCVKHGCMPDIGRSIALAGAERN